jgi:glycosyltransferase involved in cell wall biosynthesis
VAPLHVAFVIPAPDVVHREDPEADCLLRAWQADADVEASAVRVSDIPLAAWPLVLSTMSRADVIHVLPTSSSVFGHTLPALAVARLLGRPAILSHGDDQIPDRRGRSAILRRVLNASAKSVVPSSVMVDALARAGIRATMIPHAVELGRFPFRDRHAFRPRVLSVRNFEARDNVAATLRAFDIVQRRWPAATLTLVGRGSQEANLRALAADLGLRHVIFIAPLAQAGLAAAYADHDIFVQSANVDNGPTSMLRAFASGLPVVATTAGAVPAMLTHGVHGLLAPLADYETLGHHVLRLLASPDWARGLARAAHATCEAWSWPRVREQWLRTYASVLVPPARTTRSVLTRFILGSVPFAGTGLPIGAERTDGRAAQRPAS